MTVLERSELEASPLADLHAIANQVGIDGFRRLRKAELIDAILGVEPSAAETAAEETAAEERAPAETHGTAEERTAGEGRGRGTAEEGTAERGTAGEGAISVEEPGLAEATGDEDEHGAPARRRRFGRLRRVVATREDEQEGETTAPEESHVAEPAPVDSPPEDLASADQVPADLVVSDAPREPAQGDTDDRAAGRSETGARRRGTRAGSRGAGAAPARPPGSSKEASSEDLVEGVVELLPNGSAFLRVDPAGASDDVYVSAAQVRRCELVAGDRVSGPARQPRRSERYPSLVRVDSVNGVPASTGSVGARYEEQPAAFPNELLSLGTGDVTLEAIEQLTPFGLGSRAIIVGAPRAGKTEALQRIVSALAGREGLELSLVLVGIRPEEVSDWPGVAVATLSFAAPQEAQGQAVEQAIERGKRIAARGGNALVAIDTLDGLAPAVARKAMAAARNLAEAGSLTVIATATQALGGETTVISLDLAAVASGRLPAIDPIRSGTIKPELLVGEDGARRIRALRSRAIGR